MPKRLAIALGVVALGAAVVAPAQASVPSVRVTKSEANAALRAFNDTSPAAIRLSSDGRHYCAEDWHTVVVTNWEGGDASFTKKDAAVILDAMYVRFDLWTPPSGISPLFSERTSIKSVPDPSQLGVVNAYYFNQGRVLSPDELAVGEHGLGIEIYDISGPHPILMFADSITFFIDAAGTGACL